MTTIKFIQDKSMEITKANINDFIGISCLDRIAWKDNKHSDFIPDGEHIWRLWVEYSSVYVAKKDNLIIGSAVMFAANDENIFLLHKMFVDNRYRGLGIGGLIFEHLTEELDRRKVDCMLTTDPLNSTMIRLCAKHGFTDKKFVASYYGSNEDRYVIHRRHKAE